MSEQWYCPKCGPTTTYEYCCRESDTLFIHCAGCQCLDVSKETPPFVLAMQERIAELERWKEEATQVLVKWDEVFDQANIPNARLGASKPALLLVHLTRLEKSQQWVSVEKPPKGTAGPWTKPVVVVTNFGNVWSLSYFHGEGGGCWQTPRHFAKGEVIEWWTLPPREQA